VKRPFRFRRLAIIDIKEAISWHEERKEGLGAEFRKALRNSLIRIATNPETYRLYYRNVRRVIIQRFGYSIYYLATPEKIVVVAVLHGCRDPLLIRMRLRG
jgi:toxin ParE1/3/4